MKRKKFFVKKEEKKGRKERGKERGEQMGKETRKRRRKRGGGKSGKERDKEREKSRKRKNTNSHPRHFVALGIKSVEGPTTAVCPLTLAYSLKEVNATLSYATGANPQPRILQRAVGETHPTYLPSLAWLQTSQACSE